MDDHGTEFVDDQLPEPATSAMEWQIKGPPREDNGAFDAKAYFTSLAQSTRKTARCLEDRRERDGQVALYFTEETIAIATLMLSSLLEDKWSPNLAAFTKHAKSRKTVNDDDARLLFNGNPALMKVINTRAEALPDCSGATKRPAAQNRAGGGGKRDKTKKDAVGRLSAMGRSKSPTPFDEDSNSAMPAQPQPWRPAAARKDVDNHSAKVPKTEGAAPRKTTNFDDIQRPTGFAKLTSERQATKHRTDANFPKPLTRVSNHKPAPGSSANRNTIDRFVSRDCSNGSKAPPISVVTSTTALASIPEKPTSYAPKRTFADGADTKSSVVEVEDDFYNDEVMVLDPLDQALNGGTKQKADATVAEDDDEVLSRALGEVTPSRGHSKTWRGTESQVCSFLEIAPSPATASTSARRIAGNGPESHKDNTVKGFTFLSDDEEQSSGANGNVVSVAKDATIATGDATARRCVHEDSFDDDIQWDCPTQDMPKAKPLEEVYIATTKNAALQSSTRTTSSAKKPIQTSLLVSESSAASTIHQGNRANLAKDALKQNSVRSAACAPKPPNVTGATKRRFSAFSFDDYDDLGAFAASATTSAAPHKPAQASTPILHKAMSGSKPHKPTSAAHMPVTNAGAKPIIADASTVRNLPAPGRSRVPETPSRPVDRPGGSSLSKTHRNVATSKIQTNAKRNEKIVGAAVTSAKRKPIDKSADDDKKSTEPSATTIRRSALLRHIPSDDFDDFYNDDIEF